ncbi:hypothetical protein IEQ34_004725 [Dendrobium chrysotoxum]|uniref:Uncharacterized protein n=1 Tax=Dendrobium chrysotoxum TaxID=161865 RepID=A0AAV7HF31_DENCH|nr:hypothetical protein IEQ34_004725 [Dendrobium chrysotoxum]
MLYKFNNEEALLLSQAEKNLVHYFYSSKSFKLFLLLPSMAKMPSPFKDVLSKATSSQLRTTHVNTEDLVVIEDDQSFDPIVRIEEMVTPIIPYAKGVNDELEGLLDEGRSRSCPPESAQECVGEATLKESKGILTKLAIWDEAMTRFSLYEGTSGSKRKKRSNEEEDDLKKRTCGVEAKNSESWENEEEESNEIGDEVEDFEEIKATVVDGAFRGGNTDWEFKLCIDLNILDCSICFEPLCLPIFEVRLPEYLLLTTTNYQFLSHLDLDMPSKAATSSQLSTTHANAKDLVVIEDDRSFDPIVRIEETITCIIPDAKGVNDEPEGLLDVTDNQSFENFVFSVVESDKRSSKMYKGADIEDRVQSKSINITAGAIDIGYSGEKLAVDSGGLIVVKSKKVLPVNDQKVQKSASLVSEIGLNGGLLDVGKSRFCPPESAQKCVSEATLKEVSALEQDVVIDDPATVVEKVIEEVAEKLIGGEIID